MGRKKKKTMKPWCWYCNREFDDEKILCQHQKAKHFKCHICHKRVYTGPGLAIHCMQVHKEKVDKVPNSLPGRNNVEIEIYGMEGIPPEDMAAHEQQKLMKQQQQSLPASGDTDDEDEGGGIKPPQPPPPLPPQPSMAPMHPMMGGMGGIPGMMGFGMPAAGYGMRPAMPGFMGGGMRPPQAMMGGMQMQGGLPTFPPQHTVGPPPPTSAPPPPQPPAAPSASKPLFPAAMMGNGDSSVSPKPPPTGQMPLPPKPTFPAYGGSDSNDSSSLGGFGTGGGGGYGGGGTPPVPPSAAAAKKPELSATGNIRLMHPDEDVSLEERRALLPKYRHGSRHSSGGGDFQSGGGLPRMAPSNGGGSGFGTFGGGSQYNNNMPQMAVGRY